MASAPLLCSPRTAGPQPRDVLRLALLLCSPRTAGPQPRDVLRLALLSYARLGRRGPSPATSCGSHYSLMLASDGGAPAPRRPAARTTLLCSPRTAGPQPRDVLRLALLHPAQRDQDHVDELDARERDEHAADPVD